MVLTCAGMSSGPSVSWLHPAFSGASLASAVVRSSSTVGSAFSWIVSAAGVWRMNSVTTPCFARASPTNLATSAVRSTKPRPEVWTARSEETTLPAWTVDGAVRDIGFTERFSNLAGDILLHPVGHFHQPAPGPFQKRHHAI